MTTIYSKYPHTKTLKELHKTDDRPKIALQKFLNAQGYLGDPKNIERVDSGYRVRIGKRHYLAF